MTNSTLQPSWLEDAAGALGAEPAANYVTVINTVRAHYLSPTMPPPAIYLMRKAIDAGKSHLLSELVTARQAEDAPADRHTIERVIGLLTTYDCLKSGIRATGALTESHIKTVSRLAVNIAGGIGQHDFAVAALKQVSDFYMALLNPQPQTLQHQPAYQP